MAEVKKDEARDRLTESAFIGFQMGAGGDKTFGQYLEAIGLKEKTAESQTMTPEDLAAFKRLATK